MTSTQSSDLDGERLEELTTEMLVRELQGREWRIKDLEIEIASNFHWPELPYNDRPELHRRLMGRPLPEFLPEMASRCLSHWAGEDRFLRDASDQPAEVPDEQPQEPAEMAELRAWLEHATRYPYPFDRFTPTDLNEYNEPRDIVMDGLVKGLGWFSAAEFLTGLRDRDLVDESTFKAWGTRIGLPHLLSSGRARDGSEPPYFSKRSTERFLSFQQRLGIDLFRESYNGGAMYGFDDEEVPGRLGVGDLNPAVEWPFFFKDLADNRLSWRESGKAWLSFWADGDQTCRRALLTTFELESRDEREELGAGSECTQVFDASADILTELKLPTADLTWWLQFLEVIDRSDDRWQDLEESCNHGGPHDISVIKLNEEAQRALVAHAADHHDAQTSQKLRKLGFAGAKPMPGWSQSSLAPELTQAHISDLAEWLSDVVPEALPAEQHSLEDWLEYVVRSCNLIERGGPPDERWEVLYEVAGNNWTSEFSPPDDQSDRDSLLDRLRDFSERCPEPMANYAAASRALSAWEAWLQRN